ncbi:unnamed protein product (macronuclear) [Paramecium tetraurelia]|uniref:EF-hand domain-containing protein n=1 Tax=Paramecium tetraurelia TaxID=5888 RepID=A0DZK5_PARTE|nr:uncharacterized protein GSPATT00021640001 [Paramecium tetraurelia]CAK88472.1 unnamed protein product [Paramecium tetraurelia]|eukprot:XP_001455869.1 hypothetical protein (macronuclear) [Paramecium tetraurelia strain d4-2]
MNTLVIVFVILLVHGQEIDWGLNLDQEQKRDYLIVNSNVQINQAGSNNQQKGQYVQGQDQGTISEENKRQIYEEFLSYDLDEDGILRIDELKQSFRGEAEQQVRKLFGFGDKDMNGFLNFEEFFKFRTRDSMSDL